MTRKQISAFVRACRENLPESGLNGRCVHLMPDGRVLVDTKAYAELSAGGGRVTPVVTARNVPEHGARSVVDYLAGRDSGWWTGF